MRLCSSRAGKYPYREGFPYAPVENAVVLDKGGLDTAALLEKMRAAKKAPLTG